MMKTDFTKAATDWKAGFAEAAADRQAIKQDLEWLLEMTYKQSHRLKADAIFGYYLKGGRDVTEWVADQLQIACESGKISAEEFDQIMDADLLWGGQLRTTQAEVILVLEVSWLTETSDVERAADRAAILRRLKLNVLPVAAGYEWAEGVPELARKQRVILTDNGRVDDASWQAALSN
jgi:hypothetical protein